MIIDRDVPIPMDDGNILRADIFRPDGTTTHPIIMTLGPYGKGVPYRDGYKPQWEWLTSTYPDILPGSSREYMTWETVDPETWVPWGYVCIRVDSRGAGRSGGYLDIFSPREVKDYYEAIEWAAVQPWSSGKVGLNGISYYAINQWLVASLQPPHLTAMIPWEGAADAYRDFARHGGIESNGFLDAWYPRQVVSVQHGNAKSVMDPWMKERSSGPETLDEAALKSNRSDPVLDILKRPLDGEWYRARSADWSKVTVPFLSAANWAGFGLHPRGNFEAFTQAASKQKWLECHPGRHEEWFYLEQGIALQKRFLDFFLKGVDNGWDQEPPVLMHTRRPFSDEWVVRKEESWPLPGTDWTEIYLHAKLDAPELRWAKPTESSSTSYHTINSAVTFSSPPLEHEMELTGPLMAKIFASSSTQDLDLFLTVQAFSPAPKHREVEFQGTVDPHTPLAQGWLRASHRKLDGSKSLRHRPYHSHDEIQLLEPGTVYELDVEIWPTNIHLPKGYTIALQVSGRDFERPLPPDKPNEAWTARGSGPWLHTHPEDRTREVFDGQATIHTGGSTCSYLLLPVVRR
ncbi:hypothetical protein LTR84_002522 [Exophiala bonariae]|uniref:Xaa-Pro dipeptidyl-peptidase C-terminal domain-containing protein n=1 Tax=Exophiala bonariae TaxID=1690606 RepID=A0AAV9NDD2_9EURO|nr:hypothetical protein LTR84_002522 [Exophiala bonariae]